MLGASTGPASAAFAKHFDSDLTSILRPHQLEGLRFLLPRLLGEEPGDRAESAAEDAAPVTGAILADDMGTGKSLTALAALWCLCRHGKGKAVIVCPSTLVDNWRAEVKKWFPKTLDRTSLFINGSNRSAGAKGTDSVVEAFATAHPAMRPLLVLSYDMFRTYADVLNDVTTFSTVICDEGHRLKNAEGTKTTLALGNCCAMQRLVLTGTPIQNNLDELYAVVQFAAPGYLGELKEYQTRYADPIAKRPSSSAAKDAKNRLREKLCRILLRRNRDSILRAVLPPRVVTGVVCRMSGAQREAYLAECALVSREAGRAGLAELGSGEGPAEGRDTEQPSKRSSNKASSSATSGSNSNSSSSSNSNMMVLSKLLALRQIASAPAAAPAADLPALLEGAVKMRILDALLAEIRVSKPTERVVIVSNFISTLDSIHMLARKRKYLTLRLDGDVAADKRQNIVNHFNNPREPFFLMLLSAKAGGVGLNLVGATRLILWEPDWNPSTDEQAMARVWRDGQTKSVFIYRMIADNSIEETILQRQLEKNELHSVIKESSEESTAKATSGKSPAPKNKKRSRDSDADIIEDDTDNSVVCASGSTIGRMVLPRGATPPLEDEERICMGGTINGNIIRSSPHHDDILDSLTSLISSKTFYAKDMSS
jgi:DNA repair and recombination RAD54-like protein